jgi:excinuclease ABC subunit C
VTPEHLRETLGMLPDSPGIYKYFDADGKLMYVGKAKSLRKRVSSYFNKQQHENRKTHVLVSRIQSIDFTVVDSEMDALLLENSLIKEFSAALQHQPQRRQELSFHQTGSRTFSADLCHAQPRSRRQ